MGTLMCSWSVRNSGLTMDLGLLWGRGVADLCGAESITFGVCTDLGRGSELS